MSFWCPITLKKVVVFEEDTLSDTLSEVEILSFVPQSGEESKDTTVGLNIQEPDHSAKEQVTAFSDEDAGWKTDIGSAYDPTMDSSAATDADLGAFLGRPVAIQSTSWAVGSPLFLAFNPWEDFITHSRIKEKLAYYELLRCKMHVKIVISGTGFHYGRAICSYNPLSGYDDLTVTRNFLDIDVIGASQRPHFFINPTNNEGGEMMLPFFFLHNYMSLSKKDYSDMGEMAIKSFGNLKHANGGNDPVTVTVYAWAEDVSLTMPTSTTSTAALVPQSGVQKKKKGKPKAMNSGDEYGQGIISGPATAIANAAGALSAVPFLQPYARATEIVASGVGQVAKAFGYSRPNLISEQMMTKPMALGNLANTDASDGALKLTVDSKAETTIDSRTVGLDGADQMSYHSIATRESYLTSFDFTTSDAVDSLLWNTYVTPMAGDSASTELHLTSMATLAAVHESWKGSIKYRFQIVKSNFHKGRLLVRYDPRSHSATVDNSTNYSRVIDLAECDDFEIIVGWGQNRAFLDTPPVTTLSSYHSNSSRLTTDSTNRHNGVLEIDVLNQLVSPGVDADISVNVYVSMCDDFEFAAPQCEVINTLSPFVPQSGFEPQSGEEFKGTTDKPTASTALQTIGEEGEEADHTMEVFFGEKLSSIRQLCKRYMFNKAWYFPSPATNGNISLNLVRTKSFPLYYGWDPEGEDLDSATGLIPLTLSRNHFINWFAPCYAGRRGAMRSKWLLSSAGSCDGNFVSAERYPYSTSQGPTSTALTVASSPMNKSLSYEIGEFSGNGMAVNHASCNGAVEIENPFYQESRMVSARIIGAQSNGGPTDRFRCFSFNEGSDRKSSSYVQRYAAAGEDFSLFFWTGPPIWYSDTITPST